MSMTASSEAVTVRETTAADLPAYTDLVQTSMQDAYANPQLDIGPELFAMHYFTDPDTQSAYEQQLVPTKSTRGWAAWYAGKLVAVLTTRDQGDYVEIIKLHVQPDLRGQGMGTRLMGHALRHWGNDRHYGLEVLHYNDQAKAFYQNLGFRIDHSVPPIRYDQYPVKVWPAGHRPEFWLQRMWREPYSREVQ